MRIPIATEMHSLPSPDRLERWTESVSRTGGVLAFVTVVASLIYTVV